MIKIIWILCIYAKDKILLILFAKYRFLNKRQDNGNGYPTDIYSQIMNSLVMRSLVLSLGRILITKSRFK